MSEEIKNGNLNNVDGLLLSVEANEPVPMPEPIERESEPEPTPEAVMTESESQPSEDVDDYGTEIPKQEKVYTQAEVDARINEAIRKRLKERTDEPQQAPQQNFEYDATSTDSWESQLEAFNEAWFTKRQQKERQIEMQRQEQETQANFEVRFNQGASKYQDFEQVVMGKALTPQMVIATRGMQDPAAFIYAAAKTQAPELDRISKINDPYAQAIELGRLEERMRKARSGVSQAPKPIEQPRGDVSEKVEKTWSIDDKLMMAERESRKERMRGRTQ